MIWLFYTLATLFVLFGAVCVVLVVVGLPGAWILIATALGFELLDDLILGTSGHQTFGWWALGIAVVLALVGEGLELLLGAAGAKGGGASKRGMVGATIGGIGGGVVGTFLLPIPIVGTLLGAALGSALGAIVGETSAEGVTVKDSIKPATGAAIGRVLGTVAKLPVAVTIWVLLSILVFWP